MRNTFWHVFDCMYLAIDAISSPRAFAGDSSNILLFAIRADERLSLVAPLAPHHWFCTRDTVAMQWCNKSYLVSATRGKEHSIPIELVYPFNFYWISIALSTPSRTGSSRHGSFVSLQARLRYYEDHIRRSGGLHLENPDHQNGSIPKGSEWRTWYKLERTSEGIFSILSILTVWRSRSPWIH